MPRVIVPVATVVVSGLEVVEVNCDVANDHYLLNGDGVILIARNNGAVDRNVTLFTAKTFEGGVITVSDPPIVITALETRYIGPFNASLFNQSGADEGRVHFDGDHADLRFAAIRFPH